MGSALRLGHVGSASGPAELGKPKWAHDGSDQVGGPGWFLHTGAAATGRAELVGPKRALPRCSNGFTTMGAI